MTTPSISIDEYMAALAAASIPTGRPENCITVTECAEKIHASRSVAERLLKADVAAGKLRVETRIVGGHRTQYYIPV